MIQVLVDSSTGWLAVSLVRPIDRRIVSSFDKSVDRFRFSQTRPSPPNQLKQNTPLSPHTPSPAKKRLIPSHISPRRTKIQLVFRTNELDAEGGQLFPKREQVFDQKQLSVESPFPRFSDRRPPAPARWWRRCFSTDWNSRADGHRRSLRTEGRIWERGGWGGGRAISLLVVVYLSSPSLQKARQKMVRKAPCLDEYTEAR